MHLSQTSSCVTVPALSSLIFCVLTSKYCLTQSNEPVWSRGVYALVKCLLQFFNIIKMDVRMALTRTFNYLCLAKNSLHYASYGNPYLNKWLKMYIVLLLF